jgi:hypothetical protein
MQDKTNMRTFFVLVIEIDFFIAAKQLKEREKPSHLVLSLRQHSFKP